jgi:hypothetical protein
MSRTIFLLPIYATLSWTGAILPFNFISYTLKQAKSFGFKVVIHNLNWYTRRKIDVSENTCAHSQRHTVSFPFSARLFHRVKSSSEPSRWNYSTVPSWSCCCSKAVYKPVWHIPLRSVQCITPDDGQRNCPKHIELHSKVRFEKLVHLVGFIIRKFVTIHDHMSRCTVTYHDARSHVTMHDHMNVKK